jgi:hypothetical protein
MSISISEEDKNLEPTEKALENMRKDVQDSKEIEQELAAVWEKIRNDAFIDCPKRTYSLASTIRVIKTPISSTLSGISPIKSITIFDRTIVAGDEMVINPETKGPVDYAGYVHDGYVKDGIMYGGHPFLTNALADNDEKLNNAIERALRKLGKKYEGGA